MKNKEPESPSAHARGSLTARRNWILGGYSAQYDLTVPLKRGELCALVDGYFHDVYPLLESEKGSNQLLDFKGRYAHDTLIAECPAPKGEEVFSLGGEIATAWDGAQFSWSPFELAEHSTFASFKGNHHILHSRHETRSKELPGSVKTHLCGQTVPLKPHYFRFGIEHFRSGIVSALFGYLPAVAESLLVDIVSERLSVRLVVDTKVRGGYDPFTAVSPLKAAARLIARCCDGVDIAEEYLTLLRRQIL